MAEEITMREPDVNGNEQEGDVTEQEGSIKHTNAENPDYEGLHMIHLRQALQKTVKKCVESVRYSTFSKHYRFAHESSPQVLRGVMQQFKEQLESSITNELELMIEEENLVSLFNELDRLIKDTSQGTQEQAWRPSGDAETDIQPYLYQTKLEEKEKLLKILKVAEEETERLKKLTNEKKEKLVKTQEKIEVQLKLFDMTNEACKAIPAEAMEDMNSAVGQS